MKKKLKGRIYYDEDWNGNGEYFVFQNKWTDEDEWGTEVAFPLVNDMIHYTALTQIRKWLDLGIEFYFTKKPADLDEE